MQTHVDLTAIQSLFSGARQENRDHLYEYEVYDLIRYAGSETPPAYHVLLKEERLDEEILSSLPGDRVVLKILSPYILHKSDVGGVIIVDKTIGDLLSAIRRMYMDIPERFAETNGYHELEESFDGLSATELTARISNSIKGVILCQFMPPDSHEFGNELLVSLRRTREFGLILSAGLGGTDTELYAKKFRKGQAVVAASTEMVSGEQFFALFQQTISYKKLAGLTRGQKRIVTDDQLLECFSAMIEIGRAFSPIRNQSPYIIEELEINPFAFRKLLMLPLDGLCKFSLPDNFSQEKRSVHKINNLLHPKSIGIIGISSKGLNIGRIILNNIQASGFPANRIHIIHPDAEEIDGVQAVPDLQSLPERLDMLVLAVNAAHIPALIDEILRLQAAESVILIPGGIGEKKGQEHIRTDIQNNIRTTLNETGWAPVFLGANCLGLLSNPGNYDATFIPESKLPKHYGDHTRTSVLVSQSGAYMITRMSKLSFLDPAYAISIGNQIDLTAGDFMQYFHSMDDIRTIAFYMEGFADLDGLNFAEAIRQAVPRGKEVIFYKAGRTREGKNATSGHTASIAGDYMVCESCINQAGAMVAENFTVFEGLLRLSCSLHNKKIAGNQLAAVSNAGYESVGIADNILGDDYTLEMAVFTKETKSKLNRALEVAALDGLADVGNPMDITPMASEQTYEGVIEALLGDANTDVIIVAIVPLTPLLHTLPDEIVQDDSFTADQNIIGRISRLNAQSPKPLVMVIDSGPLYDHLANGFEESGLPVFRSADQAVSILGKYVQNRLQHQPSP